MDVPAPHCPAPHCPTLSHSQGRGGQGCGGRGTGGRDAVFPTQGSGIHALCRAHFWEGCGQTLCPLGGRLRDGLGGPHLPDASSHLSPLRFTVLGLLPLLLQPRALLLPSQGPEGQMALLPPQRGEGLSGAGNEAWTKGSSGFLGSGLLLSTDNHLQPGGLGLQEASKPGWGTGGALQASDGQQGRWGRLCLGPPLPGPTAQAATQPQQAP